MNSETLMKLYGSSLKKMILKHVNDESVIDDILQEVAVRIQKNENKLETIINPEAWLIRITKNLIADHYRMISHYDLIEDIETVMTPELYETDNFNEETAACLIKLMDYLPPVDQEALIEIDYNGVKQVEISQKWGLSPSGSKNRIQRARKKLKSVFQSCCDVTTDKSGNVLELLHKESNPQKYSCHNC